MTPGLRRPLSAVLATRKTNIKPPEHRPKLSTKELSALLEVATAMCPVKTGKSRSARLTRQEVVIEDQAKRLSDQERELMTLMEENQMLKKRLRSQESSASPRWMSPVVEPLPATPSRLHHPVSPLPLASRQSIFSPLPSHDVDSDGILKAGKAAVTSEGRRSERLTPPRRPPQPKSAKPRKGAELLTPGFVLKRVSPSSHQDYRELVTEDEINRRHSKAEAEEKKIIRRDRAREKEAELRRRMIHSPRYAAYTRWLPTPPPNPTMESPDASPTRLPVTLPPHPDFDKLEHVYILDSFPTSVKNSAPRKRILGKSVRKGGRKLR